MPMSARCESPNTTNGPSVRTAAARCRRSASTACPARSGRRRTGRGAAATSIPPPGSIPSERGEPRLERRDVQRVAERGQVADPLDPAERRRPRGGRARAPGPADGCSQPSGTGHDRTPVMTATPCHGDRLRIVAGASATTSAMPSSPSVRATTEPPVTTASSGRPRPQAPSISCEPNGRHRRGVGGERDREPGPAAPVRRTRRRLASACRSARPCRRGRRPPPRSATDRTRVDIDSAAAEGRRVPTVGVEDRPGEVARPRRSTGTAP